MMRDRLVHPEAQVHPSARLGVGCFIGRNVIIAADVTIGNYACIGGSPEHKEFFYDYGGTKSCGVVIEEGARIFEFVTVHSGTRVMTRIGRQAAVFNHSHVAHDCLIGDGALVGGQVSLAGHTILMPHAQVAGKSCTHQFSVIGPYAFLSAMSYLKGHMPPGEKWIGSPARPAGLNDIGLERARMSHDEVLQRWGSEFQSLTTERKV